MFYWIESVQGYNVDGWDYLTELRSFVEGGMSDRGFIDAVSGIVNRGCHNPVSDDIGSKLFRVNILPEFISFAISS